MASTGEPESSRRFVLAGESPWQKAFVLRVSRAAGSRDGSCLSPQRVPGLAARPRTGASRWGLPPRRQRPSRSRLSAKWTPFDRPVGGALFRALGLERGSLLQQESGRQALLVRARWERQPEGYCHPRRSIPHRSQTLPVEHPTQWTNLRRDALLPGWPTGTHRRWTSQRGRPKGTTPR